jgi:insertion element IS1 protein InsB
VGDRSSQTLKPLYERVDANFNPVCYATDDYACYTATLPEAGHATGKDLTYTTEQHNSDTRHWLARFRRKSKVVSHCANMVRLSLIAVEYIHKGEGLRKLTELSQSVFTRTLKYI